MKAGFYLSGHGYGHATREVAVMNALFGICPEATIVIRSRAPEWLFKSMLVGPYEFIDDGIDIGVVEVDISHQDVEETLRRYSELLSRKRELLENHVEWVRNRKLNVIVSDIPPLASEIGLRAGIPVVAIGNFSWDYIYDSYSRRYPMYAWVVDEIIKSYQMTNLLLRLPFSHEMSAFPRQRIIPLIAREATGKRTEVLRDLGVQLKDEQRAVLVAIRHSGDTDRGIADLIKDQRNIVLTFGDQTERLGARMLRLGAEWQRRFMDILSISDVVISKMGYSIVAECLVTRTPLMFPPRYDYPEHELLVSSTAGVLPWYALPSSDFDQGLWRAHVEKFLNEPLAFQPIDHSGAAVAAECIIKVGQGLY